MLSSQKTSQHIRFEQRWDFRNRESESSDEDSEASSNRKDKLKFLTRGSKQSGDDDLDPSSSNASFSKKRKLDFQNKEYESTSHDSESSPTSRRIPKKHKLVADLIAVQSDEHRFCPRNEDKDKGNAGTKNRNIGKRTNTRMSVSKEIVQVNSKADRDFYEDTNSIKRNNVTYKSTIIDDLNMFRKSVIEELKDGREKIFEYMKEEMREVLANKCTSMIIRKESVNGKEMQIYGQSSVENVQLKQKKSLVKDMVIHQSGMQPILKQYSRRCRKDVGMQHQKCSLEKIISNQPVIVKNTDGGLKYESSKKIKSTNGFLGEQVQLFDPVGSFQGLANQGNPRQFIRSYLPPRITTRRRVMVLGLVRNPALVFQSIPAVHFRPSKLPMILGAPSCRNAPLQNSGNSNRPFGSDQHQVPENQVRIRISNVNSPTTLMKKDNGQVQRMFSTMNSFNMCCDPMASSKNHYSPAAFREMHGKNCRAVASFDPAKIKAALDPSSIILALCSPVRYSSRKQQEQRNTNCSEDRRVSLCNASWQLRQSKNW